MGFSSELVSLFSDNIKGIIMPLASWFVFFVVFFSGTYITYTISCFGRDIIIGKLNFCSSSSELK